VRLASNYINGKDAEAVRSDLESIFLPHIEDKFGSDVKESEISVKKAKNEASEKHRRINSKVQKLGGVLTAIISSLGFAIITPAYAVYAYLFHKENAERQKLIDIFSYKEEQGNRIEDEYRKSWNKSLKNTITLSLILFLALLRDKSPRFYKSAIDVLDNVFENEDVITGDNNWFKLVFKHSKPSEA
jgi:hypothetical protein